MTNSMLPKLIRKLEVSLSQKLKIGSLSEHRAPRSQVAQKMTITAFLRDIPRSSTRYAAPTSNIEMDDVSAATTIVRKNRIETILPSAAEEDTIVPKMYGSVSNMRPGPAPGSIPAAKTAGMIANPAMSANSRSNAAVPKPEASMSASYFI